MKLGIIGCGKMGTSLVAGAVRSGMIAPENLTGFDPSDAARAAFAEVTGGTASADLADLASSEVLVLCTKPHHAADALEAVRAVAAPDGLLVSVAAGLTIDWLESHAPEGWRVVRCMPNTPALVGAGAAAFARGESATGDDAGFTRDLLESVGIANEVPESLLDAVTGLSGSGPAYVFTIIEAMADGGVRAGLPRETALQLAAQTVLGAATMVMETGIHPGVLKDQVASPGGTTIAGLAALEAGGVRSALIEAVTAATRRSKELGGS
jgi:pyrroline-5-carboxylate reductase